MYTSQIVVRDFPTFDPTADSCDEFVESFVHGEENCGEESGDVGEGRFHGYIYRQKKGIHTTVKIIEPITITQEKEM